jgi:hypothetical protein
MALSALSHYDISQPTPLPGQRAESSTQYDRRKFEHRSSPHIAKKHGDERQQMSLPKPTRTFRERFSDALRRRLAPNTNLTVSQLAGAIGVSDNTIKNLLSKANEPSARVIDECVAMFKDTFLNEIYGCHHIHVIDPRATQKAARIAELHEELRRLA